MDTLLEKILKNLIKLADAWKDCSCGKSVIGQANSKAL